MDSHLLTIEREVLRWPGVASEPGRFGATAFRFEKREIGHLHRDRIADLQSRRRCTKRYWPPVGHALIGPG